MKISQIAHNKTSGYSLVEVIVVLAIFSVISAIAIPSFAAWSAKYRLRGAARQIYSAALKAKSEAIKRHESVVISFGQEVSGSSQAYVVFVDDGGDCKYDDGTDLILLQMTTLEPGVSFDSSKEGGAGLSFAENGDDYPAIGFQPNGIPFDHDGGIANGTAYLVNNKADTVSVVVNRNGSVRVE